VVHEPLTIGWYYQQVLLALSALHRKVGDSMWAEDRSAQLTAASWRGAPGRLYAVTDLPSAVLAIHEIVRQGEGATAHDPLGRAHEPAHYFQFAEIVEGRRFVRSSSGTWGFLGEPVPFDPAGVWPVVDDPSLATYASTAAEAAAAALDAGYTSLLDSLHRVVNGHPGELDPAVGAMFSLETQASQLVQLPVAEGSGMTAGPRFALAGRR
jgi:hypothetical protein